jgi:hypothetical protein
MKRRGFLQAIGGVGAAMTVGATTADVTASTAPVAVDDRPHTVGGYRIKWRDFQTRPDQTVLIGMWHAKHRTQDLQWVSTTTGQCYPSRDWEAVDLTCRAGWPLLTIHSTPEECAAVKQRALVALLERLRPGTP